MSRFKVSYSLIQLSFFIAFVLTIGSLFVHCRQMYFGGKVGLNESQARSAKLPTKEYCGYPSLIIPFQPVISYVDLPYLGKVPNLLVFPIENFFQTLGFIMGVVINIGFYWLISFVILFLGNQLFSLSKKLLH